MIRSGPPATYLSQLVYTIIITLLLTSSREHTANKTNSESVKKGMIRYVYVIVDCSENMRGNDMRPTRKLVVMNEMEHFVREFFDQNPISQLGFIITYKKIADKVGSIMHAASVNHCSKHFSPCLAFAPSNTHSLYIPSFLTLR
jgi:hypothetical protein